MWCHTADASIIWAPCVTEPASLGTKWVSELRTRTPRGLAREAVTSGPHLTAQRAADFPSLAQITVRGQDKQRRVLKLASGGRARQEYA